MNRTTTTQVTAAATTASSSSSDDPDESNAKKENKGEKETRKLLPSALRFRTIANVVKHNLKWTKTPQKSEDDEPFVVRHSEGGQEQLLTFNAAAYKANVQSFGKVSDRAKYILSMPSWNREDEDIEYLYSIVKRLKSFDRYSNTVKRELVRVLYYEKYESGRVVVQQGQPGLSFYIIVSGCVSMELREADKVTGGIHKQIIGELGPGASFGELALIHNSKRTATVVCKVDSEFLRVDKPDFDMVLRRSHQQRWEKRLQVIKGDKIFEDWPDTEHRTTCDRSKLREYPPNTIILSNVSNLLDNIYIIVSGHCKVVREIELVHSKLPCNRTKLILPPINKNNEVVRNVVTSKSETLHRHLLHICTIGKGQYFGVGEDLRKTYIISAGKVECLLVNTVVFTRHGDRGKTLDNIKRVTRNFLPEREQLFQCYMDNKRWRSYKKKMIMDIVQRHSRTSSKEPSFQI
ncbi:uncharacterized protein LOC144442072 [Glandiceps talaboti]